MSCKKISIVINSILFVLMFAGCKDASDDSAFTLLDAEATGLDFENNLTQTTEFSVFDYMYFYNGGGLAAADFNNDGLVDLYFTANQGGNKMFLNKGNLKFEDITEKAKVGGTGGWSTGASVVDINNDGMMDIYLSEVGDHKVLKSTNQFYICQKIENGIPVYSDEAIAYDLDLVGFATQAVFVDFDLDGDLDMFQLNHSVHENGTYGKRESFEGKMSLTAGDKYFRNDEGKFTDVTAEAGINSSVLGYGLGIVTGDVNNDGYPDIYIGNDFHENDYLYLNQQNGTFKEVLTDQINHTSRFSMGVDMADFNNDAHSDILSLDMLPYDPLILKRSLGEDAYDVYMFKKRFGYNDQFARNNLQLNNGDSTFSEIAILAGVEATDWSWAGLFLDFDNNGFKDLFVSNGIPRRMNDIDYTNFISNNIDQRKKTEMGYVDKEDLEIIEKMPQIKIPNKFFSNNEDYTFKDIKNSIGNNRESYSNGSVYVDLDNDGDLDIIVNNIEDKPFLYKNLAVENGSSGKALRLNLQGSPKNRNAIGTRVIAVTDSGFISNEHYAVRGFQSSALNNLHVGIGDSAKVKAIYVIWPDATYQELNQPNYNDIDTLKWKSGLPVFDFNKLARSQPEYIAKDVTDSVNLRVKHEENEFVEFNRERLMPHMVSTEGPALAVGDINGDGLEDVFIGSAKRQKSSVFIQNNEGKFTEHQVPLIHNDSTFEDVDAVFKDFDKDGHLDLAIAAGGNEYWGESEYLRQRIYFNDGNGNFSQKIYLDNTFITASCILSEDINGDGLPDIFVGGRAVPKNYGQIPTSYLYLNKGNREFEEVTSQYAESLPKVGMVKDGQWADINKDGKPDLILALEWDVVKIFLNKTNTFEVIDVSSDKGLWNYVQALDVDNDGDMDIIAGNSGLNSRLKSNNEEPVRMYVNDFDGNGQKEQVVTYYLQGKEVPFANHLDLTKQMSSLKKKYLYATDFANASLEEIFGADKLSEAKVWEANTFASVVYMNDGNMNFSRQVLPTKLQFSSVNAGENISFSNKSELPAILLAGNFYDNTIELGKYDASYGNILIFSEGKMQAVKTEGLKIKGQVRKIATIKIGERNYTVLVKNNGYVQVLMIQKNNTTI